MTVAEINGEAGVVYRWCFVHVSKFVFFKLGVNFHRFRRPQNGIVFDISQLYSQLSFICGFSIKGNIVGVVVERFNVNNSDNVNFAIKGSTVKQFLSTHNVSTKWSNRQNDMSTKDIYKIASKQTVMVVCHR